MKRGGRVTDSTVVFTKPATLNKEQVRAKRVLSLKDRLICAVCEKPIKTDDPVLLRNHLTRECRSVPIDPSLSNNMTAHALRLAAISSIYRVNDGVRVRQRLLPEEIPPDGGRLSQGSGELHNLAEGVSADRST